MGFYVCTHVCSDEVCTYIPNANLGGAVPMVKTVD